MIIGLNGRMQSGKDTTATILSGLFTNVERVGFADKLKDSAAAALSITREQLEELKLYGHVAIYLDGDTDQDFVHSITGRQYLQYYGTEAHRDIFGDDFWVEQVLDNTPVTDGTILVVTDMRFPNEIAGVLDRGGIAVKIRREEADSKPILHPSEQTLPDDQFDYFLDNNGTINDLYINVVEMVDWIKENRPQFRFVDNPMSQVTIV
jgi:hypothetical protein